MNDKRIYREPGSADRATLEAALAAGDPRDIVDSLLGVVHSDPDWHWLQSTCLNLLEHPSAEVRAASVTCLGHIARLHGALDLHVVVPRLREAQSDPELAGRAGDALDDIKIFTRD